VIVTNPPFGGMEEDGIENNFPAEFRTRETADLFLVLVMELLRDGGRAAIVLPDGTLFGEGIKTRIKRRLLEECNVHTIVRLPKGVFAPYTTIKTNILFFTKGESTKEVWFYEHPYPEGYKSYSKTKPMRIEEFGPEKRWWTDREITDRAWKVSAEDIATGGYNLDIVNPNAIDAGYDDPDVLLARYEQAISAADEAREALRTALGEALLRAETPDDLRRAWERVNAHWRTATDAPDGVVALRQSILRLALSGQLVEQRQSDGTVAHLLTEIARRREELPKRRSRRSSEGRETGADESIFRLPPGWAEVRLGDITEIVRGITFPATAKHTSAGPDLVPCLRTANVQASVEWDDLIYVRGEYVKHESQVVRSADLLMSLANSRELVGKIAIVGPNPPIAAFGAFLAAIRPIVIPARFLQLVLQHPDAKSRLIESATQTTNIANISLGRLRPFKCPLPPLAEQERIVERVEHLFALCDALEHSLRRSRTAQGSLLPSLLAVP
jgi:type I restriction enzyme M protein